jgi:hypothetical protein
MMIRGGVEGLRPGTSGRPSSRRSKAVHIRNVRCQYRRPPVAEWTSEVTLRHADDCQIFFRILEDGRPRDTPARDKSLEAYVSFVFPAFLLQFDEYQLTKFQLENRAAASGRLRAAHPGAADSMTSSNWRRTTSSRSQYYCESALSSLVN